MRLETYFQLANIKTIFNHIYTSHYRRVCNAKFKRNSKVINRFLIATFYDYIDGKRSLKGANCNRE